MGLLNRRGLGAQPQAVSPRHTGGGGGNHGNQGAQGNRGGHGGGGGGKMPNTGLYYGKAGEAYANQDPQAYFRSVLSQLGGLNGDGSLTDQYSNVLAQKLMDDYAAQGLGPHQRTSPIDYLRKLYGAGWLGKKKDNFGFRAGTMSLADTTTDNGFSDWYSNTNTPAYLMGQASQSPGGGFVGGGGNSDFQSYYQNQFIPGLQSELTAAQVGNADMSMADLVAGRDLMGDARRRYLARPGQLRQQGPINNAARWSWYD